MLHANVRVVEHSGLRKMHLFWLKCFQRLSLTRQHAYRDALASPPAAIIAHDLHEDVLDIRRP